MTTEAQEVREGFKRILEQEMSSLIQTVERLLEMHDTYGLTMQKSYLYRARRELIDGKDWFEWERKQRAQKAASITT